MKEGRYKWYVVAMLWLIAFFNYADRQAVFSVFPLLEKEMQLNSVQLGLLGSAFAWIYGLGGLFAGYLVDRIRRKTAILGGLQVWSVICVATAASKNFTHLMIFRALEGLGETFYFPASMSLISDYHGKKTRSRAMGMHQTSVYAGTIGGGFFAGLIGQQYGWRWSFIVFGIGGMILGFILAKVLREPSRGASEEVAEAQVPQAQPPMMTVFRHALRIPTLRLLLGAFVCSNFVATVLLSWMPKYLYDKFGMSLAMAGLTATLYVQLASMVGSPFGGWLADTLRKRLPGGRMVVQGFALVIGAPFVVLCGWTTSTVWLVVALTGWGLFKGLYDANIFASAYDVVPVEMRGATAGLMNTVGWLAGGGTAPILIGWLAQYYGLGGAISMAAIVYVLAAALMLLGAWRYARHDVLETVAEGPGSSSPGSSSGSPDILLKK